MTPTIYDGNPISKAGMFAQVPMSRYHSQLTVTPSASRSQLWKLLDKSPAHLWMTHYLNPDRESVEENQPLIFGRAAHHLLLGEAKFLRHFCVLPSEFPDLKTNAAKAWKAEQELAGLTMLRPKDLDVIRGMAGGLYAHPMVRAGILNGLIETTMVYKHEATGIFVKIRPDAIPTDSGDYSDFKTIADISDDGIERAIGENGLAMQGGMVRMAARALGLEFNSFNLVLAEKSAPYCVRVKTLTEGDLDLGEQSVEVAMRAYARCIDRGIWPGPGGEQTDAEYAQMTPWARGRIERKMTLLQKELSL